MEAGNREVGRRREGLSWGEGMTTGWGSCPRRWAFEGRAGNGSSERRGRADPLPPIHLCSTSPAGHQPQVHRLIEIFSSFARSMGKRSREMGRAPVPYETGE